MDMGIKGKTALVCASSKGLGRGCAEALAGEGVNLIINARSNGPLEEAAKYIRDTYAVHVTAFAADITEEEGRAKVLAAAGDVDILVTNAGGPPPGSWRDWNRNDFITALDANMLSPIALIQSVLPSMIEGGWGRIVNITSMSVKAPVPGLGLSNSARSGLTGFVAGTAREVAHTGVTINNLQPGFHKTDRSLALDTAAANAENSKLEEIMKRRFQTIPAGRYGTISEFGSLCAFLCSVHAGFIIGQNILLDGGAVNSTM